MSSDNPAEQEPARQGMGDVDWHQRLPSPMTASARASENATLLASRARTLRNEVPAMAEEITDAIVRRASTSPGRPSQNSRSDLREAVGSAINRFLDAIDGAPHRDRGVDELFRELGRAEARAGRDLLDVIAGLQVASSIVWRYLREADVAANDGVAARGEMADLLFSFFEHLHAEAERGHTAHHERRSADPVALRSHYARQLLTGTGVETDPAVWKLPEWLVVGVLELTDDERPDLRDLARDHLVVRDGERLIVIGDAAARDSIAVGVSAAAKGRLSLSWEVPADVVPDAHNWAKRALKLVHAGVIPDTPLIDCTQHRTQIWLHAEPALRQRLTQEILSPLLAETPNSREILSETLLVWLETRDSAPAIANHLGVHPQTIRYRWKRINELFGDSLHDPEFIVQLTMLLKASVPLWKAGNQSDFERFRAEENA